MAHVELSRLPTVDADQAHLMAWVWRNQKGVIIRKDEHSSLPTIWFEPGAYQPAMELLGAYCEEMYGLAKLASTIPEGTA